MQEGAAASGVLSPAGNHHLDRRMLDLSAINGVMGHVAG